MNDLCQCGCGKQAPVAARTHTRFGHIKGQPLRFINGHGGGRALPGESNHRWRGGRTKMPQGYIRRLIGQHPRADVNGYVLEHVLIAEHALGRHLPDKVEVHHVNEHKSENRNSNLVICEDRTYHRLLHQRLRAYKATGSVHGLKCRFCKQWGLVDNSDFSIPRKKSDAFHRSCQNEFNAVRRQLCRS